MAKKEIKLTPALPEKSEPKVKLTPAIPEEPRDDAVQTAIDYGYGAAQGATFNYADEIYGGVRALGDERPFPEAYDDHRDDARREWDEARERSPKATFAGELTGAIASPVNKIMRPGMGVKNIVQAAIEGGVQAHGASDKEDLKGQAIDTAKGVALGTATGAGMNYVTKRFKKSPNAIRSEVLGTKTKDYRVDGPGDRKKIVERIKESGMLKNRKMEYDPNEMKFKTVGKSKFQLDELEKNTEERLFNRAKDAVTKLQEKKDILFGPILDKRYVPRERIEQMATEIADEYRKRGLMKGPMSRDAAVQKVKENIYDQLMYMDGDMEKISLRQLDTLKRMAQEDVKNFSKSLSELGDNEELARITARKLKHLVEEGVGDPAFSKLNSAQHDFLTVADDLNNKIKSLELSPPPHTHLEKTNAVEGALDGLMGGSQGRLDHADRMEWMQKYVPAPLRAITPYAAEEAPGVLMRQRMLGREPQGTRDPASVPNLPEELIRTPLPRTTDELMQKKDFVLMKVAQMMPEFYESVKDTYDHEPERLGEFAQVLSMKAPHLFARDKYNRFDGRILSEKDKNQAIKDTMLRKDLNSIQQSKIITRLNETGEFDQ